MEIHQAFARFGTPPTAVRLCESGPRPPLSRRASPRVIRRQKRGWAYRVARADPGELRPLESHCASHPTHPPPRVGPSLVTCAAKMAHTACRGSHGLAALLLSLARDRFNRRIRRVECMRARALSLAWLVRRASPSLPCDWALTPIPRAPPLAPSGDEIDGDHCHDGAGQ